MIPPNEYVHEEFLMDLGFTLDIHNNMWIKTDKMGTCVLKYNITFEELAQEINAMMVGVYDYGVKNGRNSLRTDINKLMSQE